MNTPDLINKLVGHLQPVHPTQSIAMKMGRLWAWTSVWAFVVLSVLSFRSDLSARFSDPFFILETTSLLTFSVLMGLKAFRLSVPGESGGKPLLWASGGLFLIWIGAFSIRFYKSAIPRSQPFFDFHFICSVLILMGSLVPNIFLMRSIARDFALKPASAGFMAGLSSGALGGVLMQFVCSHDQAPHIFVWHALPLVLIGAVTAGLTTTWIHSRQSKQNDTLSSH